MSVDGIGGRPRGGVGGGFEAMARGGCRGRRGFAAAETGREVERNRGAEQGNTAGSSPLRHRGRLSGHISRQMVARSAVADGPKGNLSAGQGTRSGTLDGATIPVGRPHDPFPEANPHGCPSGEAWRAWQALQTHCHSTPAVRKEEGVGPRGGGRCQGQGGGVVQRPGPGPGSRRGRTKLVMSSARAGLASTARYVAR